MNGNKIRKLGAFLLALVMIVAFAMPAEMTKVDAGKPKEPHLSKKEASINVGKAFSFSVKKLGRYEITSCKASKSDIVSVKQTNAKFIVTGEKAGQTILIITLKKKTKQKKTLTCTVTVKNVLKISDTSLSLTYYEPYVDDGTDSVDDGSDDPDYNPAEDDPEDNGETIVDGEENANYEDEDEGNEYDAELTVTFNGKKVSSNKVTWKSSDEKVITVTDGNVTVIGVGNATITATYQKETVSCKVSVTQDTEDEEDEEFEEDDAE